MSKYAPPGRRQQSATTTLPTEAKPARQNDYLSLQEINTHFWPATQDGEHHRVASSEGGTLHDAAASPDQLTYAILFGRAHPRCDTDRIIFTKSNLDLLPHPLADKERGSPNNSEEISRATGAQTSHTP